MTLVRHEAEGGAILARTAIAGDHAERLPAKAPTSRIWWTVASLTAMIALLLAPPAGASRDLTDASYRVSYRAGSCVARVVAETTRTALLFERLDVRAELSCPRAWPWLSGYLMITSLDGTAETVTETNTCRSCRSTVSVARLRAIGFSAHRIVFTVGAVGDRRWASISPAAGADCTGFKTTLLNCQLSVVH